MNKKQLARYERALKQNWYDEHEITYRPSDLRKSFKEILESKYYRVNIYETVILQSEYDPRKFYAYDDEDDEDGCSECLGTFTTKKLAYDLLKLYYAPYISRVRIPFNGLREVIVMGNKYMIREWYVEECIIDDYDELEPWGGVL